MKEALREWGVGGKTSSGYGRLLSEKEEAPGRPPGADRHDGRPPEARNAKAGDLVTVEFVEEKTKKGKWKARHLETGMIGTVNDSECLPAETKAGDRAELAIASIQPHAIAFRLPSKRDLDRGTNKAEGKDKRVQWRRSRRR